ncbi:MAG TPA: 50S ribosomal protein L10 [Acidimicrobiales bacterium]|nr:50S ribosomal protein L10 [Acidimicrobiales bacterium]
MDHPRPDKVAVVDEVRERLGSVDGAILTEYRGLTVAELAELRKALRAVGGDYKVYKNTLVRLAVTGSRHEPLRDLLTGPTAIAFVSGEITSVAKALRDYGRTNPALVIKGGMLGDGVLSSGDLTALADLPSRDVLLAQIAGTLAGSLRQLAGLIQALPRDFAYGLKALIDSKGGVEESAASPSSETAPAEAPADAGPADAAPAEVASETAPTETGTADADGPPDGAEPPQEN